MFTVSNSRAKLLELIVVEVATNGLADRSLRDIAEAIGSSHRMLHYHFGSRGGLVSAIVEATESAQRDLLVELASTVSEPEELVMALWHRVASPELRPFVRLFFECVALTGGEGLTDPWLDVSARIAGSVGVLPDEDELRLGVAVTRGLLIDVLAHGDAAAATRSIERFLELWHHASN